MTSKQTVAVVGASADRGKFGNKAVRAYVSQGWDVFPVNAKGGQIEGLDVCTSLADVPVKIDRVTLYLAPQIGLKLLPDIKQVAPGEFFVNPGAESDELIAAANALGLEPILACSIVEIGASPSEFSG